jgi:uncharacterized protein (TIRG00374 family)
MEFLRRRLGLIARLVISILVVGWLVEHIHWHKVWSDIRTMDPRWLLASFFSFLPVVGVVSWRWRMLLRVHGVFELTMIGQFFSAVGVGTTGGDVVKIFYVARAVPQRRAAVAFTVIVDRVIGLVALLLFGAVVALPELPVLLSQPYPRLFTRIFYGFALAGMMGSVGACFGPIFLRHPAIRSLLERLPFFQRGASLLAAYERTAAAFGTNLVALLGSIPSQICITLMGYCILRAMHLQPGVLIFCAIMAMVNMLIAIPISIGGLGVREQLFIWYLALIPIDSDHAFTFSLTYYFLNLLWSLLAAPFYFLYRHETHTPAPDPAEVEPLFSQS